MFNRNKDEVFSRYISMDVLWLLHNNPEFNRQSAEWTERDEPSPKRGKTQRLVGKDMSSVFWDARGIILYRKGPDHQQRVLHSVIGSFKR
jgi:hypothetical protein